ncbi:MAG: DNA polymerase III subunit gamma/tau [Proteobacteria bacterium]|nr:DNA polymerase III subunit gamma/tau [Pseudomonadota bacterium]
MSYQVLARKWRPSNFSEVAGQAHVLRTLENALDNQRLHHAYLFTGTRGVGKTTLARILAKCLNCEEGISSTPCEKCGSCIEINQGRFIDLIEVDAASRTKVEDTRELLDNVQYSPARGKFKVYLIDEVHMLSNHSFNALLKTLEEPPPHVKFLFATTDPHKLPVTILSRCLQLNLKNLSPQIIVEHLSSVLGEEKIEFDEESLWQIAAAASGSMRDALTLVDQAISYCQGKINSEGVIEMLGVPEQKQVVALLDAMAVRDAGAVISLIEKMAEQTPDYVHSLDSLLSVLHRIAVAQVLPDAADNSFGDKQQILDLAAKFSGEDVQLYYQLGIKGRDDLRLAGEMRTAFEMILLRMLVFSPDFNLITESEQSTETQAATETVKKKHPAVARNIEPKPPATPQHEESDSTEQVHVRAETGVTTDQDAHHHNAAPKPITHATWLESFINLGASGIVANVLANSELIRIKEENVYFVLDESQSAVFNEELLPKLSQAVSQLFDTVLKVHIKIGKVLKETPALKSQRLKQEQHKTMVNEFEQDENVQQLLKRFSGTLARESIASTNEQGKS